MKDRKLSSNKINYKDLFTFNLNLINDHQLRQHTIFLGLFLIIMNILLLLHSDNYQVFCFKIVKFNIFAVNIRVNIQNQSLVR